MLAKIVRKAAIFALIGGLPMAYGATIVVPGADASTEGDTNNGFPFNIAAFNNTSSQRYQQVYSSTQFGSGPILITGIDFRPDASFGAAFSSTLPNISIDLSTTAAAVGGLSLTFASNIGSNDTVELPSGPLSLSSADTGPVGGPKNFDIAINFTTPFLYDPSKGNLLLEVVNSGGGSTTPFDADGTSNVVSRIWANDASSATATDFDSQGLVTQFVFRSTTAVPEPGLPVLCGIALGAIALNRRLARK